MKTTTWVALGTLGLASLAQASGFAVGEQGSKATGMAAAFVALADDPSAQFYNPAGMLNQEKDLAVAVGLNLVLPGFEWKAPDGSDSAETKTQVFPIPYLYAQYRVSEELVVGLAEFSSHGLGVDWGKDWAGSSLIRNIDLKTFTINPNVAYRLQKGLHAAVGLDLTFGSVAVNQGLSFGSQDANMELAASGSGFGANAGLQYQATPELVFGLNYRSAIQMTFKGDADFTGLPDNALGRFVDQKVESKLKLPHNITAAGGYKITPEWFAELDVQYVTWSAYDKFAVDFKDNAPGHQVPQAEPGTVTKARDWSNGFSYHLGTTYDLRPGLQLRAGYLYEEAPNSPDHLDPSLPDSYRHFLALGVGYEVNPMWIVDLSFLKGFITERETSASNEFPGKYSGSLDVAALTATFRM